MMHYYSTILSQLEKGLPLVHVCLASQTGSAPRSAGARMLVYPNGVIAGTVGGGKYEGIAIHEALNLMLQLDEQPKGVTGAPATSLHFSLSDVQDMDMICGGNVLLLLDLLLPLPETIASFQKAMELEKNGAPYFFALCLDFAPSANADGYWKNSGQVHRFLVSDPATDVQANQILEEIKCVTALQHDQAGPFLFKPDNAKTASEWLIDPHTPLYKLHIFGAGHVSRSLAEIAHFTGFACTVLDDRQEFASQGRFLDAQVLVPKSLAEADNDVYFHRMGINSKDAIIIVTRGHAFDRDVLASALKTKAGYIGMIGSRSKREIVYASLQKSGVTKEELAQVNCPIGLEIGAETPEEIAISIVAELVDWKRCNRRSRS